MISYGFIMIHLICDFFRNRQHNTILKVKHQEMTELNAACDLQAAEQRRAPSTIQHLSIPRRVKGAQFDIGNTQNRFQL